MVNITQRDVTRWNWVYNFIKAGVKVNPGVFHRSLSADLNLPTSLPNLTSYGIKTQMTVLYPMIFGDVGRINSDGVVEFAKSDNIVNSNGLMMCCDSSVAEGSIANFLIMGIARNDSWNWDITLPHPFIFLSIQGIKGHTLTQQAPTDSLSMTQIIAIPKSSHIIVFTPQLVQVERR